jgi:YegS/Rv2252/BmrU family lipid kinase
VSLRTLVIVNPKSRGGRRVRRWPAIERELRARLDGVEIEYTAGPRDAERLARDGVRAGAQRIVIAGGDGTASEVASGLLSAALGQAAELAFLPFGTGRDWARGLGIPGGVRGAIDAIAGGCTRNVDAGRVTFRDASGAERYTHFLNVGSVGLAAAVVKNVAAWSKSFGGQLAFATGFLRSMHGWRASQLSITVDGEPVMEERLDLAAVANGRFFGGGMQLAPAAKCDDGLFDVIAVRAMSSAKWLRRIPLVYSGRHLDLDEVVHLRGRSIEVAWSGTPGEAPFFELDGEATGCAPVRFEVLPGALRVLVPQNG